MPEVQIRRELASPVDLRLPSRRLVGGKLVLHEVAQSLSRRMRAAAERLHRLDAPVEVPPAFGDVVVDRPPRDLRMWPLLLELRRVRLDQVLRKQRIELPPEQVLRVEPLGE